MKNLIVKNISQLLLTDAIKYGLKNNVFDGSFINQIREEGAAMTVKYAHKFYNAHYETDLRQSADVVIGICNLGAILWSDNDVKKASYLLGQNGLVQFFNKGINAVKELSQQTKKHEHTRDKLSVKMCGEFLSISSDLKVEWTGYEKYLSLSKKAQERINDLEFIDWLAPNTMPFNEGHDKEVLIETAALSMLIYDMPVVLLSLEDVVMIMEFLVSNKSHDVCAKIQKFITEVPQQFCLQAEAVCTEVSSRVLLAGNQENRMDIISVNFNIEMDADALLRLEARAFDASDEERH